MRFIFLLQLLFITMDQLVQHVSLDSLPASLGGTYIHSHLKWLNKCRKQFQPTTVPTLNPEDGFVAATYRADVVEVRRCRAPHLF